MSARKDRRPYLKLTIEFVEHPKIVALSMTARWHLLELWSHCARFRTDGVVNGTTMRQITTPKTLAELVQAGLVEPDGNPAGFSGEADSAGTRQNSDAKSAKNSAKNSWKMHDYLKHQTSRAEQDAKADISRSNGKKGGRPRNPAGFGAETQLGSQAEVEAEGELSTYVESAAAGNVRGATSPQHALDLVRRLAPSGFPRDVLASLATVTERVLGEPGVDLLAVDEGVAEWFRRPDAGPGLLPHLVGDAAKARQKPSASKAVVLAEMVREARG